MGRSKETHNEKKTKISAQTKPLRRPQSAKMREKRAAVDLRKPSNNLFCGHIVADASIQDVKGSVGGALECTGNESLDL